MDDLYTAFTTCGKDGKRADDPTGVAYKRARTLLGGLFRTRVRGVGTVLAEPDECTTVDGEASVEALSVVGSDRVCDELSEPGSVSADVVGLHPGVCYLAGFDPPVRPHVHRVLGDYPLVSRLAEVARTRPCDPRLRFVVRDMLGLVLHAYVADDTQVDPSEHTLEEAVALFPSAVVGSSVNTTASGFSTGGAFVGLHGCADCDACNTLRDQVSDLYGERGFEAIRIQHQATSFERERFVGPQGSDAIFAVGTRILWGDCAVTTGTRLAVVRAFGRQYGVEGRQCVLGGVPVVYRGVDESVFVRTRSYFDYVADVTTSVRLAELTGYPVEPMGAVSDHLHGYGGGIARVDYVCEKVFDPGITQLRCDSDQTDLLITQLCVERYSEVEDAWRLVEKGDAVRVDLFGLAIRDSGGGIPQLAVEVTHGRFMLRLHARRSEKVRVTLTATWIDDPDAYASYMSSDEEEMLTWPVDV